MLSLRTNTHAPAAWLMAGADRDDARDEQAGDSPDTDFRSLRVLIVEDEFFISLNTEIMLEALGHAVVGVAVSADEAERMAERGRPDVILMDIRLIGARDGIDAAIAIHQKLGIRSFFVTANTDQHTRERALAAQPLGFIEKPLTERLLQVQLATVISKQ